MCFKGSDLRDNLDTTKWKSNQEHVFEMWSSHVNMTSGYTALSSEWLLTILLSLKHTSQHFINYV